MRVKGLPTDAQCTGIWVKHKQLNHFHDLKMHGEPVRYHPVPLFCARNGNALTALSSAMAQGALTIAVMADLDLCCYCTALLQQPHRVLNKLCITSSLLSSLMKITESMEAMLKMLMHILHPLRLPLLYLLMTLMRTGTNTGSRRNWISLLYSLPFMLFKATPNLVNSGKNTSLLSYDHRNLASKAPHTIVPRFLEQHAG